MEKSIWNHRFEFAQLPPRGNHQNSCLIHHLPIILFLIPLHSPQPSFSHATYRNFFHLVLDSDTWYLSHQIVLTPLLLPLSLCSRLSHQKKWLIKRSCVQCITKLNSIKSSTCKIEESLSSSVLHLDPCWISAGIRNGLGRGQRAVFWVIKSQKIWAGQDFRGHLVYFLNLLKYPYNIPGKRSWSSSDGADYASLKSAQLHGCNLL